MGYENRNTLASGSIGVAPRDTCAAQMAQGCEAKRVTAASTVNDQLLDLANLAEQTAQRCYAALAPVSRRDDDCAKNESCAPVMYMPEIFDSYRGHGNRIGVALHAINATLDRLEV